jgi:phage terminase large subunit
MMRLMQQNRTVPSDFWKPQPKQYALLEIAGLNDALTGGRIHPAMAPIVGYGGAAGGGKTEGMVALAMIALHQIPGVKIGYFRRTFTELEGSDGPIERSMVLFPNLGGEYNKGDHTWSFGRKEKGADWNEGNASAMRFCHCQFESDVYKYQSNAFDILMIDEATHFSWTIVRYLLTRNRISGYSQVGKKKLPKPFSVMASNPGGVGHMWYKRIFGIKDRVDT